MSLPANKTPWPPKPFDVAQSAMAGWDAWYTGDTDRLATFYQNANTMRGSTFSELGMIGTVKQFMWGRQTPQGQEGSRLHVPIAADLARTSADLIFAEPPSFIYGDGKNKNAQSLITAMFGGSDTVAELLEGGEVQSALGGCYVRLIWDKNAFDHVKLDVVHADGAIPEWRYGNLTAVTFWTKLRDNGKEGTVVRHLERHAPGVIEHAVYVGSNDNIGHVVPLEEYEEVAWAADLVDANGAIPTNVTRLTAGYVPNIRPNRAWRNTTSLAPLGRSDYDQLEPLLDAADEAYTSMMRELRIGKARVYVDQSMLQSGGPGQGARFDMDQEVFAGVPGLGPAKDGSQFTPFQPEIRHSAHRAIIMDICSTILRTAGYSASDFGEDPLTGQQTATEVNSKRNLSIRTRDKKIHYWKRTLEELAATAVELERIVYNQRALGTEPVTVRFPTKIGVDPLTMAQTIDALNRAGAISQSEKVRRANPNWDEEQIKTEVSAIQAERGTAVPDPYKITE